LNLLLDAGTAGGNDTIPKIGCRKWKQLYVVRTNETLRGDLLREIMKQNLQRTDAGKKMCSTHGIDKKAADVVRIDGFESLFLYSPEETKEPRHNNMMLFSSIASMNTMQNRSTYLDETPKN
jgi:hypothetical protein